MVYEAALYLSVIVEAVHHDALGIALGIAAACHNYARAASLVPLDIHLVELVVINSLENLIEVGVEHGKDYLCLGVAEAAVILYYLGSLGSYHKSEVETALESSALCVHSVHGREEYLLHALLCDLFCVVRIRRDSSHSAGVESLVAVESAFVVH